MVIYLPISFLSNWIWNFIRTNSFKKLLDANTMMASSMGLNTPLRINEMHDGFETEMRNCLIGDMYLSEQEEGWPLIDKSNEDEFDFLRHDCEQSSWRMAKSIFCLAVIWFTTEYLSNAALANTSVASTTVLTSTSGLFTLFFGAYLGQDSLSIAKIVAVFVSISGVAMTTIGKTWAIDEPQNISEGAKHSIAGDIYGLLAAVTYGLFTVLLKRCAGSEGEKIDVQRFFGYIGLFTLLGLWWLGKTG